MSNSIDQIIDTAFAKLKTMADADTIVGKPVETQNGSVVIPISKVSVGFVAGGGEYSEVTLAGKKANNKDFPFAGGSGAGLSISPIAFISVQNNETKLFMVDQKAPLDKLIDLVPDVIKSAFEKFNIIENKSVMIVDEEKE